MAGRRHPHHHPRSRNNSLGSLIGTDNNHPVPQLYQGLSCHYVLLQQYVL
ncbi:unnamed protein product [Ectocarpus sp. 12 AP-2014]